MYKSIGECEFISVASLSLSEDNMTFSIVTDVSSFKMLNLKGYLFMIIKVNVIWCSPARTHILMLTCTITLLVCARK